MEKNKMRRKLVQRPHQSRRRLRKQPKLRTWANHKIEMRTIKAHEDEFRGQHVIVIGKDIVGGRNGRELVRLLREMEKRHPGKTPLLSFVPEKDTLYIYYTL